MMICEPKVGFREVLITEQRTKLEFAQRVLNFFSDRHKSTSVDVFVTELFDFDTEYDNALKDDLAPGLPVRFVSIPTLIRMKEAAGRPRDLDDIQHVCWILNERKKLSRTDNDIDWSLTSWEGSRRAQLRRWLALTVRERLQAIEEMAELAARIAGSPPPSERNAATDSPASVAGGGRFRRLSGFFLELVRVVVPLESAKSG